MADSINIFLNFISPILLVLLKLEKVCTLIPLTCPEPAKGKKNTLLKLLFKHLLSLEEDGGFATYQVIHKYLVKDDDKLSQCDVKVKTEKGDDKLNAQLHNTDTLIDVYKLRDFKINGTIGGLGEKDKLSYLSLSFQIENAKKLGYSDEKICAAIIRAIAPSNHLRTYFESKFDLKLS